MTRETAMNLSKRIPVILTLFFFLLALSIAFWAMYQRSRDPLAAIDRGIIFPERSVLQSKRVDLGFGKRISERVVLFSPEVDSIRIFISRPEVIPEEGLPVLIIIGGWETGTESLNYISNKGYNVLISYDYSIPPDMWLENLGFSQLIALQKTVLKIPAQIEAVARWALAQSWSDRNRIGVIAFSFGAIVTPAVYHLADVHQLKLGPAVLAYGGVDLYKLLHHNLKSQSAFFHTIISWLAATAIYPIDPAFHLPYMQGEFLVINGRKDQLIPEESWRKYQDLTASPKNIMILDAGNLERDKPGLTLQLIESSRKWLRERNAINP